MRLFIAAALAAITIALSFAHGVGSRSIFGDNQLYFFMTERCASGVPPHVAQLEVKTQLPTLIGGAAIAAGRVLGIDDVYANRGISVVAAGLAVILGWLLVLEMTASPFAALVGAAALLSIYGLLAEAASGFQPKVFMVTFLLAAHLACAQRRPLATGMAGMAAFLCWQPAGLVLASCGLATALDRRGGWPGVVRAVVGALFLLVVYEGWFAWNGALDAQLHQEWVLALGAPHKSKPLAEGLWFLATESRGHETRPHGLPLAFLMVATLMWLGLLRAPCSVRTTLRERPGLVAFWTAAHLAIAFTLYDHQAHPDMLLVQPYFAIACGVGTGWLLTFLTRKNAGWLGTVLAAVFVACGLQEASRNAAGAPSHLQRPLEAQRAQARLVSIYDDHRGSVWVLGPTHLLAFNHMDNWTPVGNVGHETSDLDMKTYRPLRKGRMPEIIVSGRGLRPGAQTWLRDEYIDITPLPLARDRIRVFSRRSEEQPGFDQERAPVANPGPARKRPPRVAAIPAPASAKVGKSLDVPVVSPDRPDALPETR